jgi:hypothetical protein
MQNKRKKFSRKKFAKFLPERQVSSYVNVVLDGIKRVESNSFDSISPFDIRCFLHTMHLSGNYFYNEITNNIGRIYKETSHDLSKRAPSYKSKYVLNQKRFLIIIFLDPIKDIFPPCYIEIHPKEPVGLRTYKKFLVWLDANLPGLKVSRVEYTSDQLCLGPLEATRLFFAEREHLYVPRVRSLRNCRLFGEDLSNYSNFDRHNYVFRPGPLKLYERGPDRKKKNEAWNFVDCDRVRLEFTAKGRLLNKMGIGLLEKFLQSPKFYEINTNKFHFRYFLGSKKLPKISSGYANGVRTEFRGSFLAQHIVLRKEVENIAAYVKNFDAFDELMSRLHFLWKRFDERWERVTATFGDNR